MLTGTTVTATGIVQARKIPVPGKAGASTASNAILVTPTAIPIRGTHVALPSAVSTTSWTVNTHHRKTDSRNQPARPGPASPLKLGPHMSSVDRKNTVATTAAPPPTR